jgi:hypothetical protein
MKKLFKKLSEQVEINKAIKAPLTEEEKQTLEKKVIFGNLVESLTADKISE